MTIQEFAAVTHTQGHILALRRLPKPVPEEASVHTTHCIMPALKRAFQGETLTFIPATIGCRGAATGMGFSDDMPPIPGGYGYFLSYGRGEGFRPGERLRCCPAVAEAMHASLPHGVMEGYAALQVGPYDQVTGADAADIVLLFVTPDQLAALCNLFHFRKGSCDQVYLATSSGCASMFRLPLGELGRENPRAVVGNLDIFSRPHFAPQLLTFAVTGEDFTHMLADADDCFFATQQWQGGIAPRL